MSVYIHYDYSQIGYDGCMRKALQYRNLGRNMKKPKPRKMTDKEFKDRVTEVATMELAEPEKLMWLSFADDGDDGFKGAIIIKAHGITDALMKCNLLQI